MTKCSITVSVTPQSYAAVSTGLRTIRYYPGTDRDRRKWRAKWANQPTEHSRWTREACPCHVGFVVLFMSASRRRATRGAMSLSRGRGHIRTSGRAVLVARCPCGESTDTTKAPPVEKRSNRSASSGTPTNGCRARWTAWQLLADCHHWKPPGARPGVAAAWPEVEGEVNVPRPRTGKHCPERSP